MKQFDKSAWEAYLQALQIINEAADKLWMVPWKPKDCLGLTILHDAAAYLVKQRYEETINGRP